MKRKIISIALLAAVSATAVAFASGCSGDDGAASSEASSAVSSSAAETSSTESSSVSSAADETASASSDTETSSADSQEEAQTYTAEIKVKDYGTITLELYSDVAPITVANFVKLAKSGFYDGLTFHRVIDGFMIQGGDPLGNGTGGSDETIKGEFSENHVENDLSHTRGVISMARSSAPDSASSQFFIVHKDSTFLDGQYAAFGKVTDGMDVVDKIAENTPVQDDNGTVAPDDQPVITSIEITGQSASSKA